MKKLLFLLSLFLLDCTNHLNAQQGLKGEYYSGKDFNVKVFTRIDPQIDFNWRMGTAPAPNMNPEVYSVRWTGRLQAPVSGTYTFSAMVDDGIRVWVGNIKILDAWGMHDSEGFSGKVTLDAGKKYDLKVEYFNGMREGEIHLLWETPDNKAAFFGHNYKPITSQYFSQIPAVQVVAPPTKTISKPISPSKSVPSKPVNKPIVQTKIPPSPIASGFRTSTVKPVNLDTVTKYIPRNVLFEKSKPIMLPESYAELDNLVAMLKRFPNKKVMVEGHTDNVGDAALNLKLSEERAKAVVDYLIQKGISGSRLTFQGFGGTRPFSNEETAEAHARNRRVAFIIK